jgi:hypothetical protein
VLAYNLYPCLYSPSPIHVSMSPTSSRILHSNPNRIKSHNSTRLLNPNRTKSHNSSIFESTYNNAPIIRFEEIMKICTKSSTSLWRSLLRSALRRLCNIVVEERCYTFCDNVQNCVTLCFQQRYYTWPILQYSLYLLRGNIANESELSIF